MARIKFLNNPSDLIIGSFPYEPLIVEKVKSIDSRRRHPLEKHWMCPTKEGITEKIPKDLKDEDIQVHFALKTISSNIKDTASLVGFRPHRLVGESRRLNHEGRTEGHNFEDSEVLLRNNPEKGGSYFKSKHSEKIINCLQF